MKHLHKDYCRGFDIRHMIAAKALVLVAFFMLCSIGPLNAQSLDASKFVRVLDGDVIEFVEGEYVFDEGIYPETFEWTRQDNPNFDFSTQYGLATQQYRAMIGRFNFERSAISDEEIAIYLIGMRWNFTVSVNEVEVFQNYATATDEKNAWYRPYLIPVSEDVLRPGLNTISIHAFSRRSVGIGHVMLGANATLVDYYLSRFFWNITAPMAANFTMLVLGLLVLIIWLARRHEIELLWLSIAVGFWFIRNFDYFGDELPFDGASYTVLAICMTYFATTASAAFYFYFIKLKHRRAIIVAMFVFGLVITTIFIGLSLPNTVIYFSTTIVVTCIAIFVIHDLLKNPSVERGVLGVTILFMPFASFYDVLMLLLYGGAGQATYLTVFGGAVFATAFIVSFGKRVLAAFDRLAQSNLILEQSITSARD